MTTYPHRQPITDANIESWIAGRLAARGEVAPIARTKIRVTKLTASAEAAIVEEMAQTMRLFGEGMTDNDLRLAGFSNDMITLCARKASARASERAHFN